MLSEAVGGGVREVIMTLDPHHLQPPVCQAKVGGAGGSGGDDKVSKRWYLLVIALLYIGLIISFCLNITLLLRTNSSLQHIRAFSPGNIQDSGECGTSSPCPPGSGWRCGGCQECPRGSWQSEWGEAPCWPCPPNTDTDTEGARSLSQCKQTSCGQQTSQALTVLSSPNYPATFPRVSSCSWTVRAGPGSAGLMVLLPALSLPPNCTHRLRVWTGREGEELLSSCNSLPTPRLLYTSSLHLRASLTSSTHSTKGADGFQLTVVSVPTHMQAVMEMVTGAGAEVEMISKLVRTMYQYKAQDQRKVSRPRPQLEVTRERKKDFVVVERRN